MTSRTQHNNPKSSGSGEALGLTYHYEMVSDETRVNPFKEAIFQTCSGKRVLESGTGSGILSILAAKAGAKKVYAVEIDSEVARFARENIEKSGYGDIIILIEGDTTKLTLDDLDGKKVDVAIAENLSTWQVTEPQIQVMNHITENLIEPLTGIRLPSYISNRAQLVNSKFRFHDVIDLRTYFFGFTGIPKSEAFSGYKLVEQVLMDKINRERIDIAENIKVFKKGIVNSVRLVSPIIIFDNIRFNSSDSLMPPVIFPLKEDVEVNIGDVVQVNFKFSKNTRWEDFECSAKII